MSNDVPHDIGSRCSARHPNVSCACVFDLSSTLSSHSLFVSSIFHFILLIFRFTFYVGRFEAKPPLCASANEESGPLVNNAPHTFSKITIILENRVNDRLRKILDHSSKGAMQDIDKHSLILGLFMSSTLEASVFMRKNYSNNLRSIRKTGNDFTLKQMLDISVQFTLDDQMRFSECLKTTWKILHGDKYL